jgi:hypothetical protein
MFSKSSTSFLLLLCFLLTLPSHLPLKVRIQKLLSAESEPEERDDSSKADYEENEVLKTTLQQNFPRQNCQLIHDQWCHEEATEERKRRMC